MSRQLRRRLGLSLLLHSARPWPSPSLRASRPPSREPEGSLLVRVGHSPRALRGRGAGVRPARRVARLVGRHDRDGSGMDRARGRRMASDAPGGRRPAWSARGGEVLCRRRRRAARLGGRHVGSDTVRGARVGGGGAARDHAPARPRRRHLRVRRAPGRSRLGHRMRADRGDSARASSERYAAGAPGGVDGARAACGGRGVVALRTRRLARSDALGGRRHGHRRPRLRPCRALLLSPGAAPRRVLAILGRPRRCPRRRSARRRSRDAGAAQRRRRIARPCLRRWSISGWGEPRRSGGGRSGRPRSDGPARAWAGVRATEGPLRSRRHVSIRRRLGAIGGRRGCESWPWRSAPRSSRLQPTSFRRPAGAPPRRLRPGLRRPRRPRPLPASPSLAIGGATDVAWPLAQAVYATPSLRPAVARRRFSARVLCGEPAPPAAPAPLRDLADSVAAVHGDDAPSRAVLDSIARRFALRGIVVVSVESGHANARAYLPEAGAFDAARYVPDAGGTQWSAAAQSLARSFASAPPPPASPRAPALATHPEPPPPPPHEASRAFWQSGWFWGAIGAAAFGAGAAYFVTRDNTGSTIHLELQVPH